MTQDLTQILNQALNKALITDRIQNPNSNKIAEWVDNFIKNNNLNPNYANKGDFCAVCGSDEFWSDEEE